MNSFNDLNGVTAVANFNDYRAASVSFDKTNPDNQTQSTLQGQLVRLPVGIDITEIIQYDTCLVSVTIDISTLSGATLNFDAIPTNGTITQSTPGVYVITHVNSSAEWDNIKNPIVIEPVNYYGTYVATVTINYLTDQTKTYTVTRTVAHVNQWTTQTPSDFWFNTGANSISTAPLLPASTDNYWTVTVIASNTNAVSTMSTAGTGGAVTYNNLTDTLTLTGTNTEINSHLTTLSLTTNGDILVDFTLTYTATGQLTETDIASQAIRSQLVRYLSQPSAQTYVEDTETTFANYPSITEVDYTGSGNYTLVITPSPTSAVKLMSGTSATWNGTAKTLTLVGTKSQINTRLASVKFTGASDYASTFAFSYALTSPTGSSVTKSQTVTLATPYDAEVSNLSIARTYSKNIGTAIFASDTPQITDFDTTSGNTYKITLYITNGEFGTSATTPASTWNYTGTASQINSLMNTIKFYPTNNYSSNTNFTYTQVKYVGGDTGNEITQINSQAITLNWDTTTGSIAATYVFNSSGTWTPTYDIVKYGKADVLLVGAGGGGSNGGGAAGRVRELFNQSVSNTSYSINVGTGGSPGTLYLNGNAGTSTSAFGTSSPGGGGGQVAIYSSGTMYAAGGGLNNVYVGGNSIASTSSGPYWIFMYGTYANSLGGFARLGGGGAGSSANGSSVVLNGPNGSGNYSAYVAGYNSPTSPYRSYLGNASTTDSAANGGAGTTSSIYSGTFGVGGQGGYYYTLTTLPPGTNGTNYYLHRLATGQRDSSAGSGGGGGWPIFTSDETIIDYGDGYPTAGRNGMVVIKIHN